MLPAIFLLGVMQTQLLELQADLPKLAPESSKIAQVETYSLKRYKYRPVTNKTKYLPINEWKSQLRKCESGGNDKAVNPMDVDSTPSYGRFQFKPSTFYGYANKYNIKVTSYLNGDEQEQLLDKMIIDNDVDLTREFPACTTSIGLPLINYVEFSLKKE